MNKPLTRSANASKDSDSSNNKTPSSALNPFNLVDENNPTLKDLYNVLKGMVESLNFLSAQYEESKQKINRLEKENEHLKKESDSINKRLQHLETEYYYQQQQQLQKHITIHGIPKQKVENLKNVIIKVANTLKVDLTEQEIISCRMINGKNNANPTPIIVVELSDEEKKLEISNKYKTNGPIIVPQVIKNSSEEHRRVYINDYLCSYYKNLLEETKKVKQQYNVKFVWIKNGIIYVRQNENAVSYKIKNYTDLDSLQEKFKNN